MGESLDTKAIVYFEADTFWLFDGKSFTPCDIKEIKEHQAGTCVPLSSLHTGNFKFLSSLGQTEKQIQTEIKMHEEGGLNSEKDYEIASCTHLLEFENSNIVEAFAISHEILDELFAPTLKQAKVIDWIVPTFITYESYYAQDNVETKTDLFFYLSPSASYAVLFHEGKYITHRQTSSIDDLAKAVGIEAVRCQRLLHDYGLVGEKYPEEEKPFFEQLQSIFSKEVEKIVQTTNHKRGLFGIDQIERIFIDFKGNNLDGLENIYAAYGMEDIPVHPLVCPEVGGTDTHRFYKAMYLYLCANGQIQEPLNLSPYERQAAWYKRHSGIFFGVCAASLLLGLLHPSYYLLQDRLLQEQIDTLSSKLLENEERNKVLNAQLKTLKTHSTQESNKVKQLQNSNKAYRVTLDTLPVMMDSRNIRQKMMYDAINILQEYKLSAVSLEQLGTKEMNIHVIADYTQRATIAKFMKKWMASGYAEARTDEIYLDENIYESKIKVLR